MSYRITGTHLMCELLGISSSEPVQPGALLDAFRLHGGALADNPDGWGIAFLSGGVFELQKEPVPAVASTLFAKLANTIRSDLLVAHVRKANFPPVNTLTNTHPFKEPCCGKEWVFAHNGVVPGVVSAVVAPGKPACIPNGQTDSEHAFCHLLTEIARHFGAIESSSSERWFLALAKVSEAVAAYGKFNFLMSEGTHLLAYGHDRLHYLEQPHIVSVATEPLSHDSGWRAFTAGELRIYRAGSLIARFDTRPPLAQIQAMNAGVQQKNAEAVIRR